MTIKMEHGVVHLKSGGKPLNGPYIPPASDIAQLGRYLAGKYSAKDADIEREEQAV